MTRHALLIALGLTALGACSAPSAHEAPDAGTSGAATGGSSPSSSSFSSATGGSPADAGPPPSDASAESGTANPWTLRDEWTGPCQLQSGAVDVNLGNSPEVFVRAAYCQVIGSEPDAATISAFASQLTTVSYVRRIDVVRAFCNQAGRTCSLAYSNPWLAQIPLTATCARKTSRDLGAVMMFFFGCPGPTNCAMDWANTHALGMNAPDPIYASPGDGADYYNPDVTGFWERELYDARYAGLQFVLPNVYGPDVVASTNAVQSLEAALDALDTSGGGIRVGMFTDTWAWGEPYGGSLTDPAPSLSDTQSTAQRIYDVEWKPFFQGIAPAHWYTVGGHPLIWFYNAGTLTPVTATGPVIAAMKQLFLADFGVTPFVDVDVGYGPISSADAQFTWDTWSIAGHDDSVTTPGGLRLDNFMVKWDSLGRDSPGQIATSTDRIFKGPETLQQVLAGSAGAQIAVLETWNDLGEGTGITRNYDYYYQGQWRAPSWFIDLIRAAQCSN